MPYSFEFDAVNAILRVNYQGQVTDASLTDCYKATTPAAVRSKARALILDLSGVSSFDVSPSTIRQLASRSPIVKDPSTPRIIVAPTTYLFGISRTFHMLVGHTRPVLHVVRSLSEAHGLLGARNVSYEPFSLED